jgi:acetyl esterase/lipase
MSRAHELLPIGPRGEPEVYAGMALSDEQRAALDVEERFAPGDPDVRVLTYRPKGATGPLPLVVAFHGGAFVHLRADSFPAMDAGWALRHGALVVSVDYRLAPEHPFPAGFDDCWTAFVWATSALDVDLDRVVVQGSSAGGALAAAVALKSRDVGGPRIALQALHIPVLDDRLRTPSQQQLADTVGFNGTAAQGMWLHYLGEDADRSATSPYAAPARADDLAGLPPAVVQVNGLDPLRDEGIEYALRLLAAGVPVELYCGPGMYHGAPPLDPRVQLVAAKVVDEAVGAVLRPH